jgi:DNA-binding LacI/PurR family transcriptional regulator
MPLQSLKILLVFNRISDYKREIYNAFVGELGGQGTVDLYIMQHDVQAFEKLIVENLDAYDYFALMPHYNGFHEDALSIVNRIPKPKLLVLDKRIQQLNGSYACVYQDFEEDIYAVLRHAKAAMDSYESLSLIFPTDVYYPVEIMEGFRRFALESKLRCTIIHDVPHNIERGQLFVVIAERHLVRLLKASSAAGLVLGTEMGIISYNEIHYKEVLQGGITVISTDHTLMGKTGAQMLLSGKAEHVRIPFRMTRRTSF